MILLPHLYRSVHFKGVQISLVLIIGITRLHLKLTIQLKGRPVKNVQTIMK